MSCIVLAVHSVHLQSFQLEACGAGLRDHAAESSGNHEASIVDIDNFEEYLWENMIPENLIPIVPRRIPSSIGFVVVT